MNKMSFKYQLLMHKFSTKQLTIVHLSLAVAFQILNKQMTPKRKLVNSVQKTQWYAFTFILMTFSNSKQKCMPNLVVLSLT